MRNLMNHEGTGDGGYPIDSDLHTMTDDGCPLVPDPARWADADWRDSLGELDTFDGPPEEPAVPAALAGQPRRPTATRRSRRLQCRTCGRMEACSPEELLPLYGPGGWPECCGHVMNYFAPPALADVVLMHSAAA